ncbi:hypothetical protein CsSME_00019754 [Camellia sinensis var. sinensis]
MKRWFWCGTLEEAKGAFLTRQPKGEIAFLIEGKANCVVEAPSESQLENELRELIAGGQCLSSGHLLASFPLYVSFHKNMKEIDVVMLILDFYWSLGTYNNY